jgi:hypothetical protein
MQVVKRSYITLKLFCSKFLVDKLIRIVEDDIIEVFRLDYRVKSIKEVPT